MSDPALLCHHRRPAVAKGVAVARSASVIACWIAGAWAVVVSASMAQTAAPRRPPSAELEAAGANPPKQYVGRYLGCFADKKQRDLSGPRSPQTSPQACVQYCGELEHSYAAMQRGQACFCGDSHGRYGPSTACKPCAGRPDESCGGPWANAVWEVAGQRTPLRLPPNLLPPVRRAPMPLSAASAAASATAGSAPR